MGFQTEGLEDKIEELEKKMDNLIFQRDTFESAAEEWMQKYQQLKDKYEPEILMEQ